MEGRRSVRRPLVIIGLIALWALVPITHNWQGRVDVHVALAWITAAIATATALIVSAIEKGHQSTRQEYHIVAHEIVREVVPPAPRRVQHTTTYIPDRGFDPRRLATLRDLQADQTGDIQGYLD